MPRPHPSTDPLQGHPRYRQVRRVGEGAYGFVSQVEDLQTGETVACKFLERGVQVNKYTLRELVNQVKLKHPHIVSLKEVLLTDDYLVAVLEYLPGGTLLQRVKDARGLNEDEARWFFRQVVFALDYCHRMGVANRDIKLENMLLDGSHPQLLKLGDFGFSKDAAIYSAPWSRVGTPAYLAPEVITSSEGRPYDGKLVDVWACGVLLYIMVTAMLPFQRAVDGKLPEAVQLHRMLQRAVQGSFSFPVTSAMSEDLKDLITKMLVVDHTRRLTLAGVLSHPWCNLEPALLQYNDEQIANSMAEAPSQEILEDIVALVSDARHRTGANAKKAEQHGVVDGLDALEPEVDESEFFPVV